MSVNWKRSLILGIVIFLYLLASVNFWPDLNKYLNALIAAILGGITAKISQSVFKEEK